MGGLVCATYLAWLCTLSMHTPPPGRCQQSTRGSNGAPPKQVHNHNLDSVALNYPSPVIRLRWSTIMKPSARKSGTREQNYFLSIIPMHIYNTPCRSRTGPDPP
jgi:hypothetical protein